MFIKYIGVDRGWFRTLCSEFKLHIVGPIPGTMPGTKDGMHAVIHSITEVREDFGDVPGITGDNEFSAHEELISMLIDKAVKAMDN